MPHTFRQILTAPKTIMAQRIRPQSKAGHMGIDVVLSCPTIVGKISVVIRLNQALVESFSIVLCYKHERLPCIAVLRLNGDHGQHRNPDGTVITGPHVHCAAPELLDAIPAASFEPTFAEPVLAKYSQLPYAWTLFRDRATIAPHEQMASRIARLHTTFSQETLDDLFRDS